ncbi:MAG: hypothetical protein H7144_04740, partial [Burkholderiales bacterium]|nr:hypothetical protein [Phycisphaerae bacterium]
APNKWLWFDSTFNFSKEVPTNTADWMPRRSLVTAAANYRNLVPTKYAGVPTVPNAEMADFPKGGTPKTSINTATFGELFRAFWQVMAEPNFTGANDAAGTIFTSNDVDAVEVSTYIRSDTNADPYKNFDPYRGMKVAISDVGSTHAPDLTSPANSQNPARMFRSPIRSTPDAPAGVNAVWATYPEPPSYRSALRLMPDQVLLLRSAIAAANLEALRAQNSPVPGGDPVTTPDVLQQRNIPLKLANGTDVTASIYGVQRQPYITEVFAQNDTVTHGPVLPGGLPGPAGPNPKGYIAIELFNPYDVPIDISDCRIGTLHRLRHTAPASELPNMRLIDTNDPTLPDMIDLSAATSNLTDTTAFQNAMIIPPKGFLVMENYDVAGSGGNAAVYRPGSVKMPAGPDGQGPVPNATGAPAFNVAYVANLHRVFNREFILMRPLSAFIEERIVEEFDPATNTIVSNPRKKTLVYEYTGTDPLPQNGFRTSFAPMDSYDLSGLPLYDVTTPDPGNEYRDSGWITGPPGSTDGFCTVWHYQRDAGDKGNGTININWRFVYPGRYDAQLSESGLSPNGHDSRLPHPRTMGTAETSAPWKPGVAVLQGPNTDTWDDDNRDMSRTSGAPVLPHDPPPSFTDFNDTNVFDGARQKTMFSIQLLAKDWPGINPISPQANRYPFGKFGRVSDLMQVPFIGSYVIYNPDPLNADKVIEVNAVTMDAAMAEDTDTTNDPLDPTSGSSLADEAKQTREQIGRFAPLCPHPWAINQPYEAGMMVTFGPDTYICHTLVNQTDWTQRPPNTNYWKKITSISKWTTGVTYRKNDIVVHDLGDVVMPAGTSASSTYLCIVPTSSVAPPDAAEWQPIAVANDFGDSAQSRLWRYRFALRLFDYFTLQAPHDDYFPHVKAYSTDAMSIEHLFGYFNYGGGGPATKSPFLGVTAVNNSGTAIAADRSDDATPPPMGTPGPNDNTENTVPIRGMININTAPWKVLSMLPWVSPPPSSNIGANYPGELWWGTADPPLPGELPALYYEGDNPRPPSPSAAYDLAYPKRDDNEDIALAIAYWRDGDPNPPTGTPVIPPGGPIRSLFDLHRIPGIRVAQESALASEPDDASGDLSPKNPAPDPNNPAPPAMPTDGIRNDFEEQYLMLNRVSNLITTRSDTFTIYVLLQGWRNAGSATAELVTERRAALILDRSQYDASNGKLGYIRVPTN